MATDLTGMSLEQLMAKRQKLAQAANRQMRRLTAAGYTKGNAMAKYAEPYLQRQGRTRFSERKTPFPVRNPYKETKAGVRLKTDAEIIAEQIRMEKTEIAQLERFMGAKTYSIKGIKEQREQAHETFRIRYGVDFDDETIDMLFEIDAFEWIRKTFGSETLNDVVKAINEGQSTAEEVIKKVNDIRVRYNESKEYSDWSVEQLFENLGMQWKPEYRQSRREETAEDV